MPHTKRTHLEEAFFTRWKQIKQELAPDARDPEREFYYDRPDSERRFDFAWPEFRVAVEMQGAIWSGGAHGRGSGIIKDYKKLNDAQVKGWRVIQISVDMLENDPHQCIKWVVDCFGVRRS